MAQEVYKSYLKETDMSEKLVLIDGHSILNRAFFWNPGSDELRGTPHQCGVWIFKYHV